MKPVSSIIPLVVVAASFLSGCQTSGAADKGSEKGRSHTYAPSEEAAPLSARRVSHGEDKTPPRKSQGDRALILDDLEPMPGLSADRSPGTEPARDGDASCDDIISAFEARIRNRGQGIVRRRTSVGLVVVTNSPEESAFLLLFPVETLNPERNVIAGTKIRICRSDEGDFYEVLQGR